MRFRVAGLSFGVVAVLAWMAHAIDAPDDLARWYTAPRPKRNSPAYRAAQRDIQNEWAVSFVEGRARVRPKDRGPNGDDRPALPFKISGGTAHEGLAGERIATKVSDGWIIAFNAGEFGAGVWWFSLDGTTRYKLSEHQVRRFVPGTEAGLLAVEGLAHGGVSSGSIVRFRHDERGRWHAETLLTLKHAPFAVGTDAKGALVVATTGELVRVVLESKKTETLLDDVFWHSFYPNSMAITPDGTTYIGMRHGVAKVQKRGEAYEASWLLPDKSVADADEKFQVKLR